jgi:hypothetical protein
MSDYYCTEEEAMLMEDSVESWCIELYETGEDHTPKNLVSFVMSEPLPLLLPYMHDHMRNIPF